MSYGLKKQISKLDPKMGYFGGPNKALENMDLKTNLVSNWERSRREERRGEEEEEEKRKKEDSSQDQAKKVWKLF